MAHRLPYGFSGGQKSSIKWLPGSLLEELRLQYEPLIAVVDDDPGVCDAIAELLEVLDYDSARFSSAEAFLADVSKRQFACVISDVRMRGMDGVELGRRLASLLPKLPIIFVSSDDDELARARAARTDAVAFLRKPLDIEKFEHQLDRALKRG